MKCWCGGTRPDFACRVKNKYGLKKRERSVTDNYIEILCKKSCNNCHVYTRTYYNGTKLNNPIMSCVYMHTAFNWKKKFVHVWIGSFSGNSRRSRTSSPLETNAACLCDRTFFCLLPFVPPSRRLWIGVWVCSTCMGTIRNNQRFFFPNVLDRWFIYPSVFCMKENVYK